MSQRQALDKHKQRYTKWRADGLQRAKDKGNSVGFFLCFNGFINNLKHLKGGCDLHVYIYLLSRCNTSTGSTHVSIETIAHELEVGVATVNRSIKRLVERGYISRFKLDMDGSSHTVMNTYNVESGKIDTYDTKSEITVISIDDV
jgi:hypothetical protein